MFLQIILILIIIAGLISSFLIVSSKDKYNRLLGLNLVGAKVYMMIIIFAAMSQRNYYLDIALVYIILGYIGVKVFTDFILARSRQDNDLSDNR